jgi:alpha-tubulin suppressor-like RCC1 family protein
MGWYRDEALNTGYSFTTMPAESRTLYAKWSFDFYSISLGVYHSSELTPTGRVFMWGKNFYGQLGDGTTTDRNVPTEITSRFSLDASDRIISLSLGTSHSAALSFTGRVFMWGSNGNGQLGDGTTTDRIVPTEITSRFSLSTGDQIISLSTRSFHTSALSATGRVFMWGNNMVGQLGDGTTQINTFRTLPIEITSRFSLNEGDQIISLFLNDNNSSALSSTGRVFMWGLNIVSNNGILGDGTMVFSRSIPTEITSRFSLNAEDKIISLSIGHGFSSALSATGRVFMWGFNEYGKLGDGTTTHRNIPIEITPRFSLAAGDRIISVSLSDYESSALSVTGRVFMWGYNGILGDGTMVFNRNVPTEITSRFSLAEGEKIISVYLGLSHSSALSSTGRLFMWGSNEYGQLGDGGTIGSNTPVVIYNVIEIT